MGRPLVLDRALVRPGLPGPRHACHQTIHASLQSVQPLVQLPGGLVQRLQRPLEMRRKLLDLGQPDGKPLDAVGFAVVHDANLLLQVRSMGLT